MVSNKDRLYVALYARGGAAKMPGLEDTYHWALIVGPKIETESTRATRYHAKERGIGNPTDCHFEEREISTLPSQMLLIRILVGKVEDHARLLHILRAIPIRIQRPGWNCVGWVKEAVETLEADGRAVGTRVLQWDTVRDAAMQYCQQKREEQRFQRPVSETPTYDLILRREIIS